MQWIIEDYTQICKEWILGKWLQPIYDLKLSFLFHFNNFQCTNMWSFKKILMLISLFWINLKGRFLQEIFTSENFGVEALFWRTEFQRDCHKSLHIKLKGEILGTTLHLQPIILEGLVILFVSIWEEHFFLLTNIFL